MKHPTLPTVVDLPAGPYRVVRAEAATADDPPDRGVLGRCDYESRTIYVKPKIARTLALLTLEHEIVHAILFDAGVKLSDAKAEAVCDAIALARVHALRRP